MKGGRLIAEVLSGLGYRCTPGPGMAHTHSFITAVELGSPECMIAFCRAVQQCSPVGAYVRPEPGRHAFHRLNSFDKLKCMSVVSGLN